MKFLEQPKEDPSAPNAKDELELKLVGDQEKAKQAIAQLEKKNIQALANIDEALDSGNKNVEQGEFGLMLAENKENGIKQSIDSLAQNFKKIEQNMDSIQNMELQKPHPDTQFNQEKQVKKNMDSAKTIQSKMDDIRRLYINLKKEDEEFDDLQSKVSTIQSSVGQNQKNLN